jgi:hypothetical protein
MDPSGKTSIPNFLHTLGANHHFRSISAAQKYIISASFPQHFRGAEIRRKQCISASFPQHFCVISTGAEI